LKVGGCIWLHHSEAESVLSVQRKVQAVDKYTFTSIDLKQWLDIQNLHVTVFSSAGSDNSESYQGSTSGLW
jgi:inositol 1,4,5-triphosphate receptor type 1